MFVLVLCWLLSLVLLLLYGVVRFVVFAALLCGLFVTAVFVAFCSVVGFGLLLGCLLRVGFGLV